MDPKRGTAIFVGSSLVAMAPFFAFVIYWGLRLPQNHSPRWFTSTIALWFVANFFIVALLAKKILKKHEGEKGKQENSRKEVPSGGICCAFGILFPLVYLMMLRRDKRNPFLTFHCIQCLLLFLLWTPFLIYTDVAPAGRIATVGSLLFLVCWFFCVVQAGRRKRFYLPIIGSIAERLT